MNRFRVGYTNSLGDEHIIAVLDSLSEARVVADAIIDYGPWIEWDQAPGIKLSTEEDTIIWRRPAFTANERTRIEEIYVMARAEVHDAGMPAERIDGLLPLSADGTIPWK